LGRFDFQKPTEAGSFRGKIKAGGDKSKACPATAQEMTATGVFAIPLETRKGAPKADLVVARGPSQA